MGNRTGGQAASGTPGRTGTWLVVAVCVLIGSAAGVGRGAEPTAAELEFFEKKIRPVLATHCYKCHGAEKQKGSLRLDSRQGLLDGGDTGEAIVPGEPDESVLIEAVRYGDDGYQMPPSGKLPTEAIADLTKWVKMGAPWPREAPPESTIKAEFDLAARAKHWSFQPIRPVNPPAVEDEAWPLAPVDRFILAELEQHNLRPAPPASKRALIRRLSFALIGLPPSPEEVADFVNDSSPQALERVVDRLLASPHFGERWGRHWLDLVRFAESHGHEFDFPIHNAWRYRDYVIRALNADVPYDDFVREHIAGDLLPQPRLHPTEGYNESILGTGFWYLGEATHAPVDVRGDEAGRIDNQIDVMTKTFLGVTVACARCHDHKFDPISTKDYYALAGYLQSSRRDEALLDPHGKIAAATETLTQLKSQADAALADALPAATEATAEDFAAYLQAACELAAAAPNDIDEAAGTKKLDPARLKRWIAALQPAEGDAAWQPDFVFKELAKQVGSGSNDAFANWKQTTAAALDAAGQEADQRRTGKTLFADFNGSDFGDWYATGPAFGARPTGRNEHDRTSAIATPATAGVAHSGRIAGKLQGALRSPTFQITGNRLFYRMAGRGGRIRLVVDGYFMDEFSGLLFGGYSFDVKTDGRFVWHTQDTSKYRGHNAYIEILDRGDGFVAVDEIHFAESGPPPIDAPDPRLAELLRGEDDSPAALAAALGRRYVTALANWQAGQADVHDERILQWVASGQLMNVDDASQHEIRGRMQQIEADLPAPVKALALTAGSPEDERVHIRGSHKKLGDVVPRRFLEAIAGGDQPPLSASCGRLELAEQIVDPNNPLTARVIVNRVWQHLFGRGIVASVDNFGVLGQPPTHPELLDTLAAEFMADGWSIKRLIRRLVLTRTYQMTSRVTDPAAEIADGNNNYLHRMRIHRLEGEAIRDAMLTISGRLDRRQFGPSVPIYLTPFMEGRGRPKESGPLDGDGRRSIYVAIKRNFLSPMMLAFDTPAPFSTVGRRTESNVPAQALILMNDPFVKQQAELWAARLMESESDHQARIAVLYEQAYARPPTEAEIAAATEFLETQAASYGISNEALSGDKRVWSDLCHVMMTLKEFTFVE